MNKPIAWVIFPFILFFTPQFTIGQTTWKAISPVQSAQFQKETPYIKTQNAFVFEFDLDAFRQKIEQGLDESAFYQITLPDQEGKSQKFTVQADDLLPLGLQAKYPNIRVFKGWKIGDPKTRIRLNYSSTSFHAIISSGQHSTYIDPYLNEQKKIYQAYSSHNCIESKHSTCQVDIAPTAVQLRSQQQVDRGGTLVYRLAMSATYNYFEFFGSSVEATMAGIVTSINRVNQVYEVDLGIRFQLVENNDTLIVTDPDASTFQTGGFEGDENQAFIDNRIGTSNYDIGHVIGVGFDAYAWLGAACDGFVKALGFTSTPSPRGDPFDIDFLAHEIGHQMGANHTYNGVNGSCGSNRFGLTAFEPGAGSTIMSYAGLCGTDDFQPNVDPYFHGGSIRQMEEYITGTGGNCPTLDTAQNQEPIITFQEDDLYIPILTPFELDAQAIDPDGDPLTYCWEQVDIGGSAPLGNYGNGNAPLFRSYPPSTDSKRTFPRKDNLLANRFLDTELLPNQDRSLLFQLTVRDNAQTGAIVSYGNVGYNISSAAGPFRAQNIGSLTANTYQMIQWEVANTNLPPINTDSVEIWLSLDGGDQFDQLLATAENDGSAIVFIPSGTVTDNARIKIKAHQNIYFDYTDSDFPIQGLSAEDNRLELVVETDDLIFCSPDTIRIPVFINQNGALDSTGLGVVAEGFAPQLKAIDANSGQFELLLLGGDALSSGSYSITLNANSVQVKDSISFPILISSEGEELDLTLLSPGSDSLDISISPTFFWQNNPLASSYNFYLASDANFETILLQRPALQDTFFRLPFGLDPLGTYYWQISANNELCGTESFSEIQAFTTEDVNCIVYAPSDLPISFNALPFIQSRIEIEESLTIRDVNVLDITGTYADISGINFKLRSPEGPVVDVINRREDCEGEGSFDFSIDDEADTPSEDCPLVEAITLPPDNPMTIYRDQNTQGIWQFTVFDDGGQGSLTGWKLEICFGASSVTTVNDRPEVDAANLKVYPNPFEEQFQFVLEKDQMERLSIRNIAGQIVHQEISIKTEQLEVMTHHWLPGFYVYEIISTSGKHYSGKLVKKK